MNNELITILKNAKEATYKMTSISSKDKDEALAKIAKALVSNADFIISENKKDIEAGKTSGLNDGILDRLALTKERIDGIANAIYKIIELNDPIGSVESMWERPNGIRIGKKRVPLGVIGIIFEARPNVTVDAAVLCLKTSNVTVLRGGKEAIHSNIALVTIIRKALEETTIPKDAVQILTDTSRETATEFMKMNEYLDVLIPRGGAGLINAIVKNATVPVIETGVGNCHIYADRNCDFKMATDIVINGKVSRPSVCNAVESLIVHKDIAKDFLPIVTSALKEKNVEIRGCEKTKEIISDITLATEDDFYKEFLDYIISIKVVDSFDDAIMHINKHSSHHSECIVTDSYEASERFLKEIDSACVYVNASTRFTDGFEFGFGAEIGISTQKLHARGPLGLNELTTNKYVIYGNGQIRE